MKLDFDPRLKSADLFLILNKYLYKIIYRFKHIYPKPLIKSKKTKSKLN